MDDYSGNVRVGVSNCFLEFVGEFLGLSYAKLGIESASKNNVQIVANLANLDSVNAYDLREASRDMNDIPF